MTARLLAVDTETTGLRPDEGHRVVEIGCVELRNNVPTGRTWHAFVNPRRDIPEKARQVHGLSEEFLADKATFEEIADQFVEFLGESPLLFHNAPFDLGFLDAELSRVGHGGVSSGREILDTMELAGGFVTLNNLCRRHGIDLAVRRHRHGALIDAQLLAEVYIEMTGGRQGSFLLDTTPVGTGIQAQTAAEANWPERRYAPDEEEARAHRAMLHGLSNPIWKKYLD